MAAKVKSYTYDAVNNAIKKALLEPEGSYRQTDESFLVEWYFDKRTLKYFKDKFAYECIRNQIETKKNNLKKNADTWLYTTINFGDMSVIFNSYQTYMFYPSKKELVVEIYYH